MSGGNGSPPDGTTPLIYVAAIAVVLFLAQVIRACRDFAAAGSGLQLGSTGTSGEVAPLLGEVSLA